MFMSHPKQTRLSCILELVLGAVRSQAAPAVTPVRQSQIMTKAELLVQIEFDQLRSPWFDLNLLIAFDAVTDSESVS